MGSSKVSRLRRKPQVNRSCEPPHAHAAGVGEWNGCSPGCITFVGLMIRRKYHV
jgi:hypothetical protein